MCVSPLHMQLLSQPRAKHLVLVCERVPMLPQPLNPSPALAAHLQQHILGPKAFSHAPQLLSLAVSDPPGPALCCAAS